MNRTFAIAVLALLSAALAVGQSVSQPAVQQIVVSTSAPTCNTRMLWLDRSASPSVLNEARTCPGSWTPVSQSVASVAGYSGTQVYTFSSATDWTIAGSTHGLGTAYGWLMQTSDGTYYYPANTDNVTVATSTGDFSATWSTATAGRVILIAGGFNGFKYVQDSAPSACAANDLWWDTTLNRPQRCTSAGTPGTWTQEGPFSDDGTTASTTRGVSVGKLIIGSVTFASLGTPSNGTQVYCSDCDAPGSPGAACTSAGAKAGAEAHRVRGGWICF